MDEQDRREREDFRKREDEKRRKEDELNREKRREEDELNRERRREEREEKLHRENERREERLLALKDAQPAVPQTVTIVNHKLPDMREGEEIETFLGMFKAALKASNVPVDQWCATLHTHLNPTTKLRIQDTIQNPDATYEMIREALIGCGSMSLCSSRDTLVRG